MKAIEIQKSQTQIHKGSILLTLNIFFYIGGSCFCPKSEFAH